MDGNFISRSSRLAGVCGQNLMMPAASLPALAKNARTGHPDLFGSIRKFKNLGHPPYLINDSCDNAEERVAAAT